MLQKKIGQFALLLLLASCHTPKPTNWAQECATRFPNRTDTFRITKEVIKSDTFFIKGMSVPYIVKTVCPPSDTIRVVESIGHIDCPPAQTITLTRTVHDSIVVHSANVATEMLLKSDIDSLSLISLRLKKENISLHKKLSRTRIWLALGWLMACLFGYIGYKTRSKQ